MTLSRSAPALAALAALLLAPSAASAQGRRWSFSLEAGAGTMLHDFDHDALSASTPAVTVTPRFGFRLAGPLAAQLAATYGRFVRERRDIPLAGGAVGLRVDPRVGALGRAWADADVGVFLPGTAVCVGFDVGAGFEFDLAPTLSLGPFVRFTHAWGGREGYATFDLPYVTQPAQDTDDIHWWAAGVSLSVRLAPRPPRR